MNKALFNIFGCISALLAIGCFATNSIALGVFLCIVAFALFAIGKKKIPECKAENSGQFRLRQAGKAD